LSNEDNSSSAGVISRFQRLDPATTPIWADGPGCYISRLWRWTPKRLLQQSRTSYCLACSSHWSQSSH